ncbi:MAG: YjbH domain-containing protein [Thermodesulfobacteriota bacterium]
MLALLLIPALARAETVAQPLPSLQSFTGIWDMPTARVLPDWNMRIKYGKGEPYRYYGVALGVFDRLEFHGHFTEVSSLQTSFGPSYGYYKDRSAGARLVLVKEEDLLPQLAVGAYDPIGTGLFPYRYLVASKMLGPVDITLGVGQGILGGESYLDIKKERGASDTEEFDTSFLFSDPFRQTRPFGGIEYHFSPKLAFSAEYSSLKYEKMFGSPGEADIPVNLGFKYRPFEQLVLQGGYLRGEELALGISLELPLNPEGILAWKKEKPYKADEARRWQAYAADNRQLAGLLVAELERSGYGGVAVSASDRALWIEARNTRYLSDAKAIGGIATIADELSPARIDTFYINLSEQGQVRQSLKANRNDLRAFQKSRIDKEGLLNFADLRLYETAHAGEFFQDGGKADMQRGAYSRLDFEVNPRIKTFLNNKEGFFKHKVLLQPRLNFYPWDNASITSELELTLYNEWGELDFPPLEPEPARTDIALYEQDSSPRLSQLAINQFAELPFDILGRLSVGLFESAYAGVGGELFRFFDEGRYGIGLEAEGVRKRDPEDNFDLDNDITRTYDTYFVNLYAQLWPEQGLDAGLKIGRFLAGDFGYRLELRRSFRYFTIGAWYTDTDTSDFTSEQNRGNNEKGVFIRVPLSIFADREIRGTLLYSFSSFLRDPGQSVRQPAYLYPMDPYSTVDNTKRTLEMMRK